MSTTNVITGWLNDDNGEKFAPKTLSTQVLMSDGNNLENKIKNIGGGGTEITIIEDGVESTLNGMRINKFDTKDEYDEATKIDGEFYSYPDEYDEELDSESTNAVQNAAVTGAINSINDKLTVSYGTLSYGEGISDFGGSTVLKIGDIVFLHVNVSIPSGMSARKTIVNLPEGFQPKYTTRFIGLGSSSLAGSLTCPCMGFINGYTVYAGDALASNIKELSFDVTYKAF